MQIIRLTVVNSAFYIFIIHFGYVEQPKNFEWFYKFFKKIRVPFIKILCFYLHQCVLKYSLLKEFQEIKMQIWKKNIINKLSEKANESKEINLYETANELGYKDILIAETQDIIDGFLEQNFNYKVIKNNPTGQLSNSSKVYLMPTIIFKELNNEELAKLNNLSKIRKNKGYTQSKLAEISGVNIRMIQKYESGERDFKKALVQTALKIADALEVTVDELFVRI